MRKRVILVPVGGTVEPECESGLQELERRGFPVRRVRGHSDIARGRSMMATAALHDGFDDIVWIDSDVEFSADGVEALLSHDVTVVGGIYPVKGQRRLPVRPIEVPTELTLGEGGGLLEVMYLPTGFLLTRREVYEDIQTKLALPRCDAADGPGIVPFFLSLVVPDGEGGHRYLSEDYSFCHRAREAGHKVHADTSVRLGHVGRYTYHWEDAGQERRLYATYKYTLTGI